MHASDHSRLPSAAATSGWAGRVLGSSLTGALLAGWGETLLRFLVPSQLAHRIIAFNPLAFWEAPLVNLALLLPVIAVADFAVTRIRGRGPAAFVDRSLAFAAVAYAALFLLGGLQWLAVLLLTAGFGIQCARLSQRGSFDVLLRRLTLMLAVLSVLFGIGRPFNRRVRFRRAVAALPAAPAGSPNVLLLILDTVSAEETSLHGYSRPTTPVLDSLAKAGVSFDYAIAAAPWTLPSHASMFTGRQAFELSARYRAPLDGTYPVVAEQFATNGYLTAGFVANLWYCATEGGLARGFQWFDDYFASASAAFSTTRLAEPVVHLAEHLEGRSLQPQMKPASRVNSEFLAWRDKQGTRPYFAFLNYIDAHTPYAPLSEDARRFLAPGDTLVYTLDGLDPNDQKALRGARAAHDAAIVGVDRAIGALLSELARRGDLSHTVVVVAADHGEEFGEHGVLEHGNSLYLRALHVPLLIVHPGQIPAGLRVATPAGTRNLGATLLDLAGLDHRSLGGESLARLWAKPETASLDGDSVVVSWVEQAIHQRASFPAARSALYSAVLDSLQVIRGDDTTAYDFRADPEEDHNLARDPRTRSFSDRLLSLIRAP